MKNSCHEVLERPVLTAPHASSRGSALCAYRFQLECITARNKPHLKAFLAFQMPRLASPIVTGQNERPFRIDVALKEF